MTCKELMTAYPVCCSPSETASRLAKVMKTENVGSVPICDDRQNKQLLGIVTDRDLAIKVIAEGRDGNRVTADEIMTRQPATCQPGDDVNKVFSLMEKNQVRRVPVVDDDGHLIGIIAQADVATRSAQPEKTAEVVEQISRNSARA